MRKLLILLSVLLASLSRAEIIPATNRISWEPGVNLGLQTPIPLRTNIIDVTQAPYNADNTGASDCVAAVQSAINDSAAHDVIFLPSGIYRFNSSITFDKSDRTLRGSNAIWHAAGAGTGIKVGHDPQTVLEFYLITNGLVKGSTQIQITNIAGNFGNITPGDAFYLIASLKGSEDWPFISSGGFESNNLFQTVIAKEVSGTTLTLTRPLDYDYSTNGHAILQGIDYASGFGGVNMQSNIMVDGITFTCTNNGVMGSVGFMMWVSMVRNTIITNCAFEYPNNYNMYISSTDSVEVRRNRFVGIGVIAPNHAGILVDASSGLWIHDNIFSGGLFPAIEHNGSVVGSAFTYNYFTNCSTSVIQAHGSHTMMVLIEGNVGEGVWQLDGYFGSQSHHVLFRNWINGWFQFKRWNSHHSVVGNVFGTEASPGLLNIGLPNIGNGYYGWIGVGEGYGGTRTLVTNPPVPWNYPGPTYLRADNFPATGGVPNGIWALTNAVTLETNLTGNFTNILAGSANNCVAFQDPVNTNHYYFFGGVTAVSAGTSSNLHLSRPVTLPIGARVYNWGTDSHQQLALGALDTYVIHGNLFYTNGTAVTWRDDIADHDIPATMLTTNAGWWDAALAKPFGWPSGKRFPSIDPVDGTPIDTIPAQDRYLGSETPQAAGPRNKTRTHGKANGDRPMVRNVGKVITR